LIDIIRREQMDIVNKKMPHLTRDETFEKTGKYSVKLYWEELAARINEARHVPCQTTIIFLDKNHPPNAVEATVRNI